MKRMFQHTKPNDQRLKLIHHTQTDYGSLDAKRNCGQLDKTNYAVGDNYHNVDEVLLFCTNNATALVVWSSLYNLIIS